MIYYINILFPLLIFFPLIVLRRLLKWETLKIILIVLFIVMALLAIPILLTNIRANVWMYEYFMLPIGIVAVGLGLLLWIGPRRFDFVIIWIIAGTLAANVAINYVLSFAAGWGGGDYNSASKNEPLLRKDNLEIVAYKQNDVITHYAANRTYLFGLLYKQVGFETKSNPGCIISFELSDRKEILTFDSCQLKIIDQ